MPANTGAQAVFSVFIWCGLYHDYCRGCRRSNYRYMFMTSYFKLTIKYLYKVKIVIMQYVSIIRPPAVGVSDWGHIWFRIIPTLPRKSKGKRVATVEINRSASMDFLSDAGFVQLGQAWATHAIRIICNVQVGSMHSEACAMVYHA